MKRPIAALLALCLLLPAGCAKQENTPPAPPPAPPSEIAAPPSR